MRNKAIQSKISIACKVFILRVKYYLIIELLFKLCCFFCVGQITEGELIPHNEIF